MKLLWDSSLLELSYIYLSHWLEFWWGSTSLVFFSKCIIGDAFLVHKGIFAILVYSSDNVAQDHWRFCGVSINWSFYRIHSLLVLHLFGVAFKGNCSLWALLCSPALLEILCGYSSLELLWGFTLMLLSNSRL